MAIFGAPVAGPQDADNALNVATDMIRALRNVNLRRSEGGLPPIEIGVGLATGEVLAGSLGSTKRMEYTVIGDNVNLAARLESANKHYGTSVLLAGATVEALKSPGILRRLDIIQVKGKQRPTLVYESLSHHTPETFPRLAEFIKAYEAGIDLYRKREWAAAISRFAEVLEIRGNDQPARMFIERCRYYRENPPVEGWEGVWVMEEK
jgi:adenylate cyclase